ncbi:hypothetical protein DSM112329_01241 [Paraconexibacter sp. AEG42_29]|uniref:TVP38/TMEM64 family membrane protein n=1 Tax=Paraconexibacter sp. AEG42_29 TaxID=2997339 RepID=A0AAU7AS32_9ACTN
MTAALNPERAPSQPETDTVAADPADPVPPAEGGHDGWLGVLLSLVAIAIAAAVVLAVPALREAAGHAMDGDGGDLRQQLRDLGATGVLVLIAVMLIHAVVLFPSELVTATAGLVYGFLGALPLVIGGWMASALLTYWLGQHAGRPLLQRIVGRSRLEQAEALVHRGGAGGLLAARLVPIVPYSLVGYVAGAARVPVGRFMWTTLVGSLPLTVMVIALGTRLEEFSLSDPVVWLMVVPLLMGALAVRPLARRMKADPAG